MENKFAFCAYWGGVCKAIAADCDSTRGDRVKWIKEGADKIILLPVEEAKAEFLKGSTLQGK